MCHKRIYNMGKYSKPTNKWPMYEPNFIISCIGSYKLYMIYKYIFCNIFFHFHLQLTVFFNSFYILKHLQPLLEQQNNGDMNISVYIHRYTYIYFKGKHSVIQNFWDFKIFIYKSIYSLCIASILYTVHYFYNWLAVLEHKAIYPILFLCRCIFFL